MSAFTEKGIGYLREQRLGRRSAKMVSLTSCL